MVPGMPCGARAPRGERRAPAYVSTCVVWRAPRTNSAAASVSRSVLGSDDEHFVFW